MQSCAHTHSQTHIHLLVPEEKAHVVPCQAANLRPLADVSGYQQVPGTVQLDAPYTGVVTAVHMSVSHLDLT